MAVLLVSVVPAPDSSIGIPLGAMIVVGVASIPGVLTFHENIGHLAVQLLLLSQDPSGEKNYQKSTSPHLVVVEGSV